LLGLAVLVVAVVPALVSVSQSHLDKALAAYTANDCPTATNEARRALAPLDVRRGAHEILAYCHAARRERAAALTDMGRAVHDDPQNWETHYGLAIVIAATGGDPRSAARDALALNPSDPVARALVATLRTDPRSRWVDDAFTAPLPVDGEYGTSLYALRAGPGLPASARPAGPRRPR
jgi:Tfp pilus assembly protein PilF